MSHEDTQEEIQSLGAFLREHREQKGASLPEATEATKISLPILKAIEEDDYDRMPAEAFSRGFYSLYSDFLDLDPQQILERYDARKGAQQKPNKKPARPPLKKSKIVTNYAEPSSISPATSMTIFAAACFVAIAGICWYLSWNPADYINTKLTPPQAVPKQTQSVQVTPATPQPPSVVEPTPAIIEPPPALDRTEASHENEAVAPSETLLAETQEDNVVAKSPQETQPDTPAVAPYHLEIHFNNSGTLKVALDDGFVLDKRFSAGKTLRWEVEKKIILDMPETISGTLRLNGIEIPLPETIDGRRMLSLPEDLLD